MNYVIAGNNSAFDDARLYRVYWTGFDCPHWSKSQTDAKKMPRSDARLLVGLLREARINVRVVRLKKRVAS